LGKRKKRILAIMIKGKKINLIRKKKENLIKINLLKFEKGKNFKRGNGSEKECWEDSKEEHFRLEYLAVRNSQALWGELD